MPHQANDPRRHKFPKARYRIDNWPTYDAALRDRGDLTDAGGAGGMAPADERPTQSIADLFRCRHRDRDAAAFGVRPALATGLLRSVPQLMNLEVGIPDHATLSRRSAKTQPGLDLAGARGPVHVVIDSTGLKVYGAGEWRQTKHGGRGWRGWRKPHLAVDPDSGEILACELRGKDVGDPRLTYRNGGGPSVIVILPLPPSFRGASNGL